MTTQLTVCVLVCAFVYVQSFMHSSPRWMQRHRLKINPVLQISKSGNFADDLFGDSPATIKGKKEKAAESTLSSNAQYLDQNWELSPEDQKEFTGFNKKSTLIDIIDNEDEEVAYPCFALIYRLRKEFVDTSIDSVLADHNVYCKKFKRLLNSEVITMKQRKGFVLLWVGLSATDKTETKSEITEFLEEDPIILKDMVEKWDLIDLEEKGNGTKSIKADSNTSNVSSSLINTAVI